MAKSDVFMQWTNVTFVYGVGPTTITIGEVEDVQWSEKGDPKFWSGDAMPGPKRKVLTDQRREVTIMGADIAILQSIPANTPGTLTAIFNDAENGEGSGALTLTLVQASIDEYSFSGKHNEFGKGNLKFSAVWPLTAGVPTDPLSVVQAS